MRQRVVETLPVGPEGGLGHAEVRLYLLVRESEIITFLSLRQEDVVDRSHHGFPLRH